MAKAKLGLSTMTPDQVIALGNTIKTAMTGNANFPTPNPTLAAIAASIATAQTKVNGYNTSKAATSAALSERDASIADLAGLLTQVAGYVDNASAGDKVKIESAGMSTRAESAPVGPIGRVLNVVVSAGDIDGTLDVGWDPLRGASSYEVHTSTEPVTGTSWNFCAVSVKSSVTLGGLTSGAKIWVRVRGVGANNQTGNWSDPAMKVVP